MSEITNPIESLNSLQQEIESGRTLYSCNLHNDLSCLYDNVHGNNRATYAAIEGGVVKSLVIFVFKEAHGDIVCQVGYAVKDSLRGAGLASDTIEKSIEELISFLKTQQVVKFNLSAVVGVNNIASNKLAIKIISAKRSEIVDAYSNEKAYYYERVIEV